MSYSRWGAPGRYRVGGRWYDGTGDWYVYADVCGKLAVLGPSEHYFTDDEVRTMHDRRDLSAVTGAMSKHRAELLWYFGEYLDDCARLDSEETERKDTSR
jgi:hypothetical protein